MHTHRSKRMDYGERRKQQCDRKWKKQRDRPRKGREEGATRGACRRARERLLLLPAGYFSKSLSNCTFMPSNLWKTRKGPSVQCVVSCKPRYYSSRQHTGQERGEKGEIRLVFFPPGLTFHLKSRFGQNSQSYIHHIYVMSLDITMQIHKGIHPSLPFALTGEDACKGKRELNSPGCSPSKPTSTSQLGGLKSLHEAFPLYTFLAMWIPKAVACVPLRTSVSRAFRRKKLKRVHVIPSLKV